MLIKTLRKQNAQVEWIKTNEERLNGLDGKSVEAPTALLPNSTTDRIRTADIYYKLRILNSW